MRNPEGSASAPPAPKPSAGGTAPPAQPTEHPTQRRTKSKYVPRSLVQHDYHDRSDDPPTAEDGASRGGVSTVFPLRLYQALESMESDGCDDVCSWQPHGRAFLVHKVQEFERIMSRYFGKMKFSSFQRQLNLYGFMRLTQGPDKGGYYHELFLRGRRHLCTRIQRMRVKGTGARSASNPDAEPDFYKMPTVGPMPPSKGAAPSPSPPAPARSVADRPSAAPSSSAQAKGLPSMLERVSLDEHGRQPPVPPRQSLKIPELAKVGLDLPLASPSSALAVMSVPDSGLDHHFLEDLEFLVDGMGEEDNNGGSNNNNNNKKGEKGTRLGGLVEALEGMETPEPLPLLRHMPAGPPAAFVRSNHPMLQPPMIRSRLSDRPPVVSPQSSVIMENPPHFIGPPPPPPPLLPPQPQLDRDVADFLRFLFSKEGCEGQESSPNATSGGEEIEMKRRSSGDAKNFSAEGSRNAAAFARKKTFSRRNVLRNAAA